MIGLVWVSRAGRSLAAHLERAWPDARAYTPPPGPALRAAWTECDGVVAFMAAGIAVRLAAPLLERKDRDPGLVCVDDAGRFAVALAGGHAGGANRLAARAAEALGATPVVTTASDALDHPALDDLGADLGFAIQPGSDLAAVGAALAAGDTVTLVSEQRWPLPPLPATVVRAHRPRPPCLVVTDRLLDPPRPAVVYRPPSLVVGVGCSSGTPAGEILDLVDATLAEAGLAAASVACLASVEAKRGEPGLQEAARARGWPLRFHQAEALARVPVPNPSAAVARAVGTASVAEAAALAPPAGSTSAAGATPPGGAVAAGAAEVAADLVVPKRKSARATVAVGRVRPRGRLYVVGTGPGDPDLVPPLARAALARCELVVGLDRYVDRVRGLLRPGTRVEVSAVGSELDRARLALAEAAAGAAVALVSGGDAGVYGMASPALASPAAGIEVTVVPGVTAALAAAAVLGAPLGHDHCAISLSDLLTPWPEIRRRLQSAAAGDFVISLYNPRSAARGWQLEQARRLLLDHRKPGTPVGLVTDAYRPGQRMELTTLGELDPARVGMTTTVVVGSGQTRVIAGRMVTPRGYPQEGQGGRPEGEPPPARSRRRVHPVESESYRILRSLVDLSGLGPLSRAVAERIVHASADPAYASELALDEAALKAGLGALRAGAPVVVDARMVGAAITARETICALDLAASPGGRIDLPDLLGGTRSAAGMRAAAERVGRGAVWVIGCAPTALEALLALDAAPALVIGLPVGFVGAVEAKRALASSGLPAVTNRSVKGGSAVAAAALNALLYWEGGT